MAGVMSYFANEFGFNSSQVVALMGVHTLGEASTSNSGFSVSDITLHHKKRFMSFPSPAVMSPTKLPLGRNDSVMTSLIPPRVW